MGPTASICNRRSELLEITTLRSKHQKVLLVLLVLLWKKAKTKAPVVLETLHGLIIGFNLKNRFDVLEQASDISIVV